MKGLRDTLSLNFSPEIEDLAEYLKYAGNGQACPSAAPAVSANPTSAAFGNQNVGSTSAGITITLSNSGGAAATAMTYATPSAPFTRTATTCGASIAAGASCTMTFTFSPSAAGNFSQNVAVAGTGVPSFNVGLSGTGVAATSPNVSAAPTSLAFGTVNVGVTSPSQTITVSNTGTGDATNMSYPAAPAKFTKSGTCSSATLAKNTSCTVVFTYTPTAATTDNATYTITGGGASIAISLSGTGAAAAPAALQASPTSLAFGSIVVGVTSATQSVTVSNTGGTAASSVSVASGNPTEFPVSSNTCGSTLNAGASCSFSVAYKPSATGADAASVTISHAAGSVAVAVSGTGAPPPTPNLQASPASLAFGSITVGTTAAAKAITVTNTGTGNATGVAYANSNAARFPLTGNTCGPTIAAGTTCTLDVAYAPSAAVADSGTLTISYTGGTSIPIALAGSGSAAATANLTASPTPVAFGNVVVGQTSAGTTVTVNNGGGAAATSVALANSNATEFVVSANTCGSTLNAGASCSFSVAYKPSDATPDAATITISHATGSVAVPMSGTGTAPPTPSLQASPTSLTFGAITVGTTAATKAISISNTGGASATGVAFANTNAAEFPVSGNTCGATIASGTTCTLNVAYAPSGVGADSETLTISYAGGTSIPIALSGSGSAAPTANLTASPTPVALGNVIVGQTSATTTITVSNGGGATATAMAFVNSNATEFVVSSNTCGSTLNAGASCTLGVAYKPAAAGTDSATLTFNYAGGGAVSISLSGTGVVNPPPPGTGQLSMQAAVVFGDQTVGAAATALTVTVSNIGSAAVTVSSITSSNAGEFAVEGVTCGTVNPGAACTFTVKFAPAATGGRAATITVTSNGAQSPQTIAVSGNGVTGGTTPPAGTTATAVEYYHAAFDHYFMTAIQDEITKLDAGVFVGWQRTGKSFKVHPNAAAGLNAVCRFFSTAFGEKSSHFYTPNAPECSVVKANPNWTFEAEVFHVLYPALDGSCPASTIPVYRMYNDGQGGAPNHRYTIDLTVRAAMLALDWIPEGEGTIGVIMCAPQ